MVAFLAVWAAAAATADVPDVVALERIWSGVRDSSEQVVMSLDRDALPFPQTGERRVRTIVTPVSVPWLGEHVLYLEEFLEDEPREPRRQILMQLEETGEGHVRAHVFSLLEPARWRHLGYRPALAAELKSTDVGAASGCELTLTRAGDQFHGGTLGRHCLDQRAGTERYLDVQLVISDKQYWYRRRLLRLSDGELQQEVIGFNRFEPNEARLYACRIAWSASGHRRDLHPLATLDLYEAGGQGRFATPDGRTLILTLHGRDWPFAVDRDALLLSVQEADAGGPLATAWAQMDAQQISLELGWLEVRCGAMAPESDELAQ
jgi:hypothetical protein